MIRVLNHVMMTADEYDELVGTRNIARAILNREELTLQDLLRAAYASDDLLHEIVGDRPMTDRERTVCGLLVYAIAQALAPKPDYPQPKPTSATRTSW